MPFVPDEVQPSGNTFVPDAPVSASSFIPDSGLVAGARAVGEEIIPAVGGAVGARLGIMGGAELGFAAGGPIGAVAGGVIGAIAGAVLGESALGAAQHEAMSLVMGEDWIKKQEAQDAANLQAHPFWTGLGSMLGSAPLLASGGGIAELAAGTGAIGAKNVASVALEGERAIEIAAKGGTEGAKLYKKALVSRVIQSGVAGAALQGGMAAEAKISGASGSDQISIPGEIVKGFAIMGPLGIMRPAQSVFGRLGRSVGDAYALGFGAAVYDTVVKGKPFDLSEVLTQGTESVPAFLAMAAFMELTHGAGAKGFMEKLRRSDVPKPQTEAEAIESKYRDDPSKTGDKTVMDPKDVQRLAELKNEERDLPVSPDDEAKVVADENARLEEIARQREEQNKRLDNISKSMDEMEVAMKEQPTVGAESAIPLSGEEKATRVDYGAWLQQQEEPVALQQIKVEQLADGRQWAADAIDLRLVQIQAKQSVAAVKAQRVEAQQKLDALKASEDVIQNGRDERESRKEEIAIQQERGKALLNPDVLTAIDVRDRLSLSANPADMPEYIRASKKVADAFAALEDRGPEVPLDVQPLMKRLGALRSEMRPAGDVETSKVQAEIASKLLPPAEVEAERAKAQSRYGLLEKPTEYVPEISAQQDKERVQEIANAKVLAKKLGVNVQFSVRKVRRYEDTRTEKGRNVMLAAGHTEQEIKDAIATNSSIRVRGSCRERNDSGRYRKPIGSTLILYDGYDKFTVRHELAHAIKNQGGLKGWAGTDEQIARFLEKIIGTTEQAKYPELTPEGRRIPAQKEPVAPPEQPPEPKSGLLQIGGGEQEYVLKVKEASIAKKAAADALKWFNKRIPPGTKVEKGVSQDYKRRLKEYECASKRVQLTRDMLEGYRKNQARLEKQRSENEAKRTKEYEKRQKQAQNQQAKEAKRQARVLLGETPEGRALRGARAVNPELTDGRRLSDIEALVADKNTGFELNTLEGELEEARKKGELGEYGRQKLIQVGDWGFGGVREDVIVDMGSIYPKDLTGERFNGYSLEVLQRWRRGEMLTGKEATELARIVDTAKHISDLLTDEYMYELERHQRQMNENEQQDQADDVPPPSEEMFSIELEQPSGFGLESQSEADIKREEVRLVQREKIAQLQGKTLVGDAGDLGQGELFAAEQPDVFAPPSPKPAGRVEDAPLFPNEHEQLSIEMEAPDPEKDMYGIRNAIRDAEISASGLPIEDAVVERRFPELAEKARQALIDNPNAGYDLVESLLVTPRSLTDDDVALLTMHRVSIARAQDRVADDAVRANNQPTPDTILMQDVERRRANVDKALSDFYEVTARGKSKTETARALSAMRMLAYEDYSLVTNVNRMKAVNRGEALDGVQNKIVNNTAKKWEAAGREERAYEEKRILKDIAASEPAEKQARASADVKQFSDMVADVKKQEVARSRTPAQKATSAAAAPDIRQRISSRGDTAQARFLARRAAGAASSESSPTKAEQLAIEIEPAGTPAALSPEDISDLADIGAREIIDGRADITAWEKVITDIAGVISPVEMGQIRERSMRVVAEEEARPAAPLPKRDVILAEMQEEGATSVEGDAAIEADEDGSDFRRRVKALVKSEAEDGVETVDVAIRNVFDLVSPFYEGVTEDNVRDAFSDYGIYRKPNPNELARQLQKWRSLSQKTGQLIDVLSGNPPKPTGSQRQPPEQQERAIRKQVYEAMKDLGIQTVTPEARLKSALESAQTRMRNAIEDIIRGFTLGETPEPSKPISYESDPMAMALQGALKDLRATMEEINGPKKMMDEEKLRMAESAMERSIKELEKRIAEKDLFPAKSTEAKPTSKKLQELSARRELLRRTLQEMKDIARPKPTEEQRKLRNWKTAAERKIVDMERRIKEQDFSKRPPSKPVVLDKEGFAIQEKKANIKKEFEASLRKYEMQHRTWTRKALDIIGEPFLLSRSLLSAFDLSYLLRQGGLPTFAHPLLAFRTFKDTIGALKSEHAAYLIDQEIKNRWSAQYHKKAGLFFGEWMDEINKQEEAFMGRLVGKIPGFKATGRTYVTFLNKMRADLFDTLLASAPNPTTPTDAELKAIGNYINIATGRGNLGTGAMASQALSVMFWSPRLFVSRLQYLLGQPLYHGTKDTRIIIAKEYARAMTGMAVVYGLGALLGGKEETDPRSSDFGKIRFGTTRVDPMAGLSQIAVFMSRVASGQSKSTTTGEVADLTGPKAKYGSDMNDVLFRFARSKFSPLAGTLVDLASRKTFSGDPLTPEVAAKNLLIPLSWADTYDLMVHQGVAGGTALTMLSVLGMGIQDFQPTVKPPKPVKEGKQKAIIAKDVPVPHDVQTVIHTFQMNAKERRKHEHNAR